MTVRLADGDEKTVTVLVDNEESTLAFAIQNSIVLPVSTFLFEVCRLLQCAAIMGLNRYEVT
jgi:hypothetical protein